MRKYFIIRDDRLKISLIISIILIPSLLLAFICFLSTQKRAYLIAIFFLTVIIISGIILALRLMNKEITLAKRKSNFVSNISHELKTPLTSINMFVDMLLMRLYDNEDDHDEYLSVIQKECNRLMNLVDRVLNYSRMESGKTEFQYKLEPIGEVVLYALKIFNEQTINNKCEITIDIPDDLPQLQIDRDAIIEALLNLLNNAVKYSLEKKKIAVSVQIENSYVVIGIMDNGIGIPEDQQKKIFEPFYRVNDPLSQSVEGSGLGLAFVKHIVEAHKGKITVKSKIGHGSEFKLFLPYKKRR